MADEVDVVVSADNAAAVAGMKEVAQGVKDLQSQVSAITAGVTSFRDAFLSAFTLDKLFDFVGAMTESASTVERLTTALGVSAATIATFELAGKSAGVTVSAISETMTRLENTITRANAGVERAQDALSDLGLRARDFNGLDTEGKIGLIADKLSVMRDGTEKTAIATALLGGAAVSLLPILNEGAEGLDKFKEMAIRAGTDGGAPFRAEMARLEDSVIEMQSSLGGAGKMIATAFGPALNGLTMAMTGLVQSFMDSIREGGVFSGILGGLVIAAQAFASAIVVSVMLIQNLWEVGKAVVFSLAQAFVSLGEIMKAAFTLDWDGVKTAFSNFGQQIAARMVMAHGQIVKDAQTAVNQLNAIWTKAAVDQDKSDQTQDANRRRRAAGSTQAALAAYDADIRAAQMALQQKSTLLDIEVSLGRMTQNQKYAALQQYTEQSYQEQLKVLQQELTVGGLKIQQVQAINNRIRALQDQHNTDMINLDRQSLQAQIGLWRQYTDAVAGAFNSQMRGILTGQLSFSQAFKNILLDLSLKTIELLVTKPVAEYIAGQLALLTANQSGAAARAATEVAASTAALPAKVATFTSDLAARAALTFAGIFANLSPILGPLAAGPAAAGEATVLAQAAAVPKFDVGSWSVPRTGLAVIHKDEMILPAGAPAEAARAGLLNGGGPGGSGGASFFIQAWDGQSVDRWLRSGGAAQLSRAVSGYQDKNPSARPRQG